MYNKGYAEAYTSMGLIKIAAAPAVVAGGKAAVSQASRWPGVRRFFKQMVIGEPGKLRDQFREGGLKRLFSRGDAKKGIEEGIIRSSMKPTGVVTAGLFYGMPAHEIGKILGDDEGDKARRIGAEAGAAALGMATWRPLGIVGSMAGDWIGRRAGRGAVDMALRGREGKGGPIEPTLDAPRLPNSKHPGTLQATQAMHHAPIRPTYREYDREHPYYS
jgi:hypothetical protein